MKYLVDLEKNGSYFTMDNYGNSKQKIIDYANDNGYTIINIVPANNNHRCKYCEGIAEGTYEDVLCEECRETFGHTFFSEL